MVMGPYVRANCQGKMPVLRLRSWVFRTGWCNVAAVIQA